jgi:hypothetical protein
MKITRRQLRQIIKEAINENREPASVDYVRRALDQKYNQGIHPSQRKGMPFSMGVNQILDALWVDDVWDEDVQALEDILASGPYASVDELAVPVADWLTKFRQGGHSTPEGREKQMKTWR